MFPIRDYIPETGTVIQHSFLGPPALPRGLQTGNRVLLYRQQEKSTFSTDSTHTGGTP